MRPSSHHLCLLSALALSVAAIPGLAAPPSAPPAAARASSAPVSAGGFKDLSASRIAEIEAMLPAQPQGLGPTYKNRELFEELAAKSGFASVITQGEALLSQPFPAWSDEAYLEFSQNGQRPRGEEMLNVRSRWLSMLVLAECFENEGRFLPVIEQVLRAYVEQPTWTLPAHDRSLTNFRRTRYEVDLVSALFSRNLAQAVYLLDDKLAPDLRLAVLAALRERIFDPVLASLKTGKGNVWLNWENNWNAVCLNGVTGAALAVLPERRERAIFLAAAEHYSVNMLRGFGEDGYCTEGLGYYNYGFRNYVELRETLWQATRGAIDLFNDPKVRTMALFGPGIEIINEVSPAIGDCRFGVKLDPRLRWYCNRALSLGLPETGSEDQFRRAYADLGSNALFGLLAPEQLAPPRPPAPASPALVSGPLRTYFSKGGVLVCRPAPGGRFGVALQGGHNDEAHNHNDVGSFTLVVGRESPVGDPGGPHAYTADSFGPQRYTKFQVFRSRTHPVPLVAGGEQVPGREAAARVLQAEFTDERDTFALDLRAAYREPTLQVLKRTFVYERGGAGELVVRDDFAFSSPQAFELSLITLGQWRQEGKNTWEFTVGNERVRATLEAPGEVEVIQEKIEENGPAFTRLGLKLKKPVKSGTMRLSFRPVE